MKKIVAISIMLISVCIQSQSFRKGIYYTVKKDIGFTSEIYEFKEQNSFNYLLFGCTGSSIGTGTYKVIKDSLFLKFNKVAFKNHKDLAFKSTTSDSLKINIKVLEDNENSPLPGANCIIINSDIGWQTDFDGMFKGSMLKQDSVLTLRISYIGFGSYDILIHPGLTEIAGVIKLNNIYFYGSDDEKKVKLSKARHRRFELEYTDKVNIIYRRINRTRALKIIEERTNTIYDNIFQSN